MQSVRLFVFAMRSILWCMRYALHIIHSYCIFCVYRMNGRKLVVNVVQMYDNRMLLSVRHGVRCAVLVRCVRGVLVRWWFVVCPWWWCAPSVYVLFSHNGTFIDRGGYGISKGCAFWVSVKSVHLPHTLPKIIFSSSLLTVQFRLYCFSITTVDLFQKTSARINMQRHKIR